MRVPLSWLREFTPVDDDPDAMATKLSMFGLKVDEVRRIVNVTTEQLLPPPPLVRGIRGELLIAVIPVGDEVLLLIDIENVLTAGEKDELRAADFTQTA